MRVIVLLIDRIYLQTVIYFEIMIRCKQGIGVKKECLLQVPLDLFDVWNVLAVLLNGRPSYTLFSSMSRIWRDKVGIVGPVVVHTVSNSFKMKDMAAMGGGYHLEGWITFLKWP